MTAGTKSILVALGGGIAFSLAAPPTDAYPLVLIGLGALYVSLCLTTTYKRALLAGCLWATAAGVVGMRFVPAVIIRFTPLGFAGGAAALILLSLFQSGTWACGMLLARALERWFGLDSRIAFATGVLVAISFTFVIAWTPAGLLSPWPALVQLAEIIGERGVSFVIAGAAALLASPLVRTLDRRHALPDRRPWFAPVLGALLLTVLVIHGAIRMREVRAAREPLRRIHIGLVQGAVEARLRWEPSARDLILQRLRRLTIESERDGAELTVWPEAAYPYLLPHRTGRMPPGRRAIVTGAIRGPVLFGLITQSENVLERFNSTTVVASDGRVEVPQAKMELLWFGETVPLGEHLPFLRRIFSRAGGLVPGRDVHLLTSQGAKMGVLNCYEDTLPAVGRKIALSEPNLLVNVTNDAWFGPTAEPELHLRLSVLRAIETRRDLVRAVNMGVPAWIDASGSVVARGSSERESVLSVFPALNDMSPTFYVKAGDTPLVLGILIALSDAFYRRRRYAARRRAITARGP